MLKISGMSARRYTVIGKDVIVSGVSCKKGEVIVLSPQLAGELLARRMIEEIIDESIEQYVVISAPFFIDGQKLETGDLVEMTRHDAEPYVLVNGLRELDLVIEQARKQ